MKLYFNRNIKNESATEFIDNIFNIVGLLEDGDVDLKITSRGQISGKTNDVYFEIEVDEVKMGKIIISTLINEGLYLMSNKDDGQYMSNKGEE